MPGLREALEEGYDELEAAPEPEAQAPETASEVELEAAAPPAEPEDAPAAGAPRDEHGRFAPASKPAALPPSPAAPKTGPAGQGATTGATPPGAAPVVAPAFKAPQSWKAGVREKWASLPPEVQGEVLRREKEVAQALQARAEAEKASSSFNEVVRPYEAQIRAAGVQPQQYVGQLLQTAHSLFYGPPGNKPDMLADLILQAGVPPEALDRALVARMNGGQRQQPQQHQPMQDPRVDKLLQHLEAAKAERNTAQAAEADATATGFADSHEFFDDVAEDFANILDVWATKGKKEVSGEDLERAYNLACQMNDDVAKTLEERRAVASVQTVQAATHKAKAASSSIRSQPTAAAAAQPTGRRATLEAAYDELER